MTENMQRTVIVTGAARGIGFAIAEACIKNGDFVLIGDLNLKLAVECAKGLGDFSGGM